MANEVRIKLTDEQRDKIKAATGKDMREFRVESLSTKASPRVPAKKLLARRAMKNLPARRSVKIAARRAVRFTAKQSFKNLGV
jgi:hypothetical protein